MRDKAHGLFMLSLVALGVLCANARASVGGGEGIDLALARQYFAEAAAACERDGGKLWGRPLCGPMIFFEPATREVVANRGDAEGRLAPRGGLFVGRLPEKENAANTATDWAGVRWSMVYWGALGEDRYDRDRLLIHESFHRIQDGLGLPMSNPSNDHLDTPQGRLWLQLEWRALARALTRRGPARDGAVADALVFREYRRTLFPRAASEERALEMNEGLAEYTGVKLCGRAGADTAAFVAARLERANARPSFTRSFAYESGPAYGLLLDEAGPGWRRGLRPADDLGLLLRRALSLRLPDDLEAEASRRSGGYDGEGLRAAEAKREGDRRARIASYRAKLVEGPVLILPLTERVNYSFDPNSLVPLDGLGTVYPTLRVTDAWGVIEVEGGALMRRGDEGPSVLQVPAPADPGARPLRGERWTLRLNGGWALEPSGRKGDYLLKMK